jgi:hypothetical protein
MKIKKWKAGRGDKKGVVQVKLRNLGDSVRLEEVDAAGNRKSCGTMLTVKADGLSLDWGFESQGIAIEGDKIKLLED